MRHLLRGRVGERRRVGRGAAAVLWCVLLCAATAVAARAAEESTDSAAIHITSPLGRTGVVGTVRIVAQVHANAASSAVRFFVDGRLLGEVAAPPYAVDWVDDNPFERREIVAELESGGTVVTRDTVVLTPFEITDKTDVNSVLLEAGVYDRNGRAVNNLSAGAFSVAEDGTPQTIELVARETLPTTTVVLVDNSQSMSRQIDFVRLAAGRIAEALGPKDRVIIAPFTKTIGAITGPTRDRATMVDAIDAMGARGGTAIFDALIASARLLDSAEGRRNIVLITDGFDENSQMTTDDVVRAAEAVHATVYIVGIAGIAGISLKGEDVLRDIATNTGGRVFFPPRESAIGAILDELAADAHSRYLITYTPSNQRKDGAWRTVSVAAGDGLRVRTRTGYLAPAPPPIRPSFEFAVFDREHAFVSVGPQDLRVTEAGVEQKVDVFQEAVDPVSIVMAIDASGSMKKATEGVKAAARDFVLAVRPEDSLALITFADKPSFAHVLATNRQWSLDAIEKYEAIGGTALYDALVNSLMHLKSARGRRAIVVLTDGRDENNPGTAPGSEHTLEDVERLIQQTGAIVFPIGLGPRVDNALLQRLATESGGEAYFPTDVSELEGQYRRVVDNLRRRYVLGYTSTNSAHDGSWRTVTIESPIEGATVTAAPGYFAPTDEPAIQEGRATKRD